MKLVFATYNQHKLEEVKQLMPKGIELISLSEIKCDEEIVESATTLEGNARIKSKYIKDHYGFDCFADDTGLEVKALNGAPGVYSARYAGMKASADANNDKLLKALEEEDDRDARFRTVISLEWNGEQYLFEGICEGSILTQTEGEKGFGYDPLFLPKGEQQTFAQMSMTKKGELSHRGKALEKLVQFLKSQV